MYGRLTSALVIAAVLCAARPARAGGGVERAVEGIKGVARRAERWLHRTHRRLSTARYRHHEQRAHHEMVERLPSDRAGLARHESFLQHQHQELERARVHHQATAVRSHHIEAVRGVVRGREKIQEVDFGARSGREALFSGQKLERAGRWAFDVKEAASMLLDRANGVGRRDTVYFGMFNDTPLIARRGESVKDVVHRWERTRRETPRFAESDRKHAVDRELREVQARRNLLDKSHLLEQQRIGSYAQIRAQIQPMVRKQNTELGRKMDWKVFAFRHLRGEREIARFVDGFLKENGRRNGSQWVSYALDKWVTPGTERRWRSALEQHTARGRVESGLRALGNALQRSANRAADRVKQAVQGGSSAPGRTPQLLPQLGAALAR